MATEKLWPHWGPGCITVPIRAAKMEIPVRKQPHTLMIEILYFGLEAQKGARLCWGNRQRGVAHAVITSDLSTNKPQWQREHLPQCVNADAWSKPPRDPRRFCVDPRRLPRRVADFLTAFQSVTLAFPMAGIPAGPVSRR